MNKRTKTIIAVTAVALVGIAGLGISSHARDGHGPGYSSWCAKGYGPGYGKRQGWGPRGGFGKGAAMFERFDTDKDGKLTQAEIDKARGDVLAKFDGNGDGKLTLQEFQALWTENMRPRMVDRFQSLDDDGDAVVSGEEFNKRFNSIVRRMDRNDDGQITRNEMGRRGYGGHRWRQKKNDKD